MARLMSVIAGWLVMTRAVGPPLDDAMPEEDFSSEQDWDAPSHLDAPVRGVHRPTAILGSSGKQRGTLTDTDSRHWRMPSLDSNVGAAIPNPGDDRAERQTGIADDRVWTKRRVRIRHPIAARDPDVSVGRDLRLDPDAVGLRSIARRGACPIRRAPIPRAPALGRTRVRRDPRHAARIDDDLRDDDAPARLGRLGGRREGSSRRTPPHGRPLLVAPEFDHRPASRPRAADRTRASDRHDEHQHRSHHRRLPRLQRYAWVGVTGCGARR